MHRCRCIGLFFYSCGLLLLGVFLLLQTDETGGTIGVQPSLETVPQIALQDMGMEFLPTTVEQACGSCHGLTQPESAAQTTVISHNAGSAETEFEQRFSAIGQLLLDHNYDQWYTQPIQEFWQVHRQLPTLRSDPEQLSAAIATLDEIEQRIIRLDYEESSGRIEAFRLVRNFEWLAAFSSASERTPQNHHQIFMPWGPPDQVWTIVTFDDIPFARRLLTTDNQRGPPRSSLIVAWLVQTERLPSVTTDARSLVLFYKGA